MTFQDRLYPPQGLRVLVTAGASGIGAAIASAFRKWAPKSTSAISTTLPWPHSRSAFLPVRRPTPMWQTRRKSQRFSKTQQARFGGLDVLVNCAGIAGPTAGVDKITEQEWTRTIDVNLNGQYRCLHHAVPMLRESKAANIICISSVAGRMGIPWRTPYVATKWAIVGIAKSLAIELGPDNIRVNAVLPGIVEGPRMDGVISARAKLEGIEETAMREDYLKHISLRRMVTADDVALMCLFLCSPAGRNVTGQAISVDGNYF